MNKLIQEFAYEYQNNKDELVDSNQKYYKLLKIIKDEIQRKLTSEYLVKSSCGQGRKSECPWICVFNKNITKGAKNGIYYAILFKSDLSGYYLSLCLGMESFKEKFKSEWEYNLRQVADYFRNKINDNDFNVKNINLNVAKNTRGHGYEISNIVAKYYEVNDDDNSLENDINTMTNIYNEICEVMKTTSYSEVIDNIMTYSSVSLTDLETANREIEQAILNESKIEEGEIITLREIEIPSKSKSNKFVEITKKNIKKRDYIESSKKQAKIGLRGEQLVIEYEKQKMLKHNRDDLIDKINWVSEIDDSRGYDIESFNFDENDKEYRIYIEVKTTENNEKNTFFISANEVETMNNLGKVYWIYRVCKTKKEYVFFKINGEVFSKKIEIKPYSFVAEVK